MKVTCYRVEPFVKHVLGRVDGGKQVTSILIITVGGGVQPNRAYSTG